MPQWGVFVLWPRGIWTMWVITLSRPEGGFEQIEWGVVIGQDGLVEGVLPLGSFCMCPPHETNLIFLHSQTTQ